MPHGRARTLDRTWGHLLSLPIRLATSSASTRNRSGRYADARRSDREQTGILERVSKWKLTLEREARARRTLGEDALDRAVA